MATNQFLPIGGSATAILNYSAWNALSQRTNGWSTGVLLPEHYNTALRQTSYIAATIGEFIKQAGGLDALDNADLNTLVANFIASIDARADMHSVGSFITVTGSPSSSPPGGPSPGDEYPVQSGATGAWAGKDGQIARYDGVSASWKFTTARVGRLVKIAGTDVFYKRAASSWDSYTFGSSVSPSVAWGAITGSLSSQTDLQNALSGKVARAGDTMTGDLTFANAVAARFNNASGVFTAGSAGAMLLKDTADALYADNYDGPIIFRRAGFAHAMRISQDGTVDVETARFSADGLEVNVLGSGDRPAYVDLHASGPPGAIDHSARVLREAGVNGALVIRNTGSGPVSINFGDVSRLAAWPDGSISFSGDKGEATKVLAGNPSGPPSWKSASDLIPRLSYQWVLATNTLVAAFGGPWNAIPLNTVAKNTIPSASASGGTVTLPAGAYRGRVTMLASFPYTTGSFALTSFRVQNMTAGTTLHSANFSGAGRDVDFEFALGVTSSVQLQGFDGSTGVNLTFTAMTPASPTATLLIEKIG